MAFPRSISVFRQRAPRCSDYRSTAACNWKSTLSRVYNCKTGFYLYAVANENKCARNEVLRTFVRNTHYYYTFSDV